MIWGSNDYSVPIPHIGTKVDLRITDWVLQAYRGAAADQPPCCCTRATNEYRSIDADLPAEDIGQALPDVG